MSGTVGLLVRTEGRPSAGRITGEHRRARLPSLDVICAEGLGSAWGLHRPMSYGSRGRGQGTVESEPQDRRREAAWRLHTGSGSRGDGSIPRGKVRSKPRGALDGAIPCVVRRYPGPSRRAQSEWREGPILAREVNVHGSRSGGVW